LSVNGIFDDVISDVISQFSNGLVRWSVRSEKLQNCD